LQAKQYFLFELAPPYGNRTLLEEAQEGGDLAGIRRRDSPPGRDEPVSGRLKSRHIALLAAVVLHAAVFAGLLLALRLRRVGISAEQFVTTLIDLPVASVPPPVEPARPPPDRRSKLQPKDRDVPAAPQVSVPVVPAQPATSPQIDWALQAEQSARAITADGKQSLGEPRDPRRSAAAVQPIFPAPVHHQGEEYRLGTGQVIEWVSSSCYLLSDPPALAAPESISKTRMARLYCPGKSGTARGDLFEQSPAYKKYHDNRDPAGGDSR
jgi:hypothetical protein